MKVTKAVIPAAGLGTRVLPATKSMPKEMLPIVDKPAIQYIVEEAVAAARENAVSGDIVSMSPASASFDMYKNFAEKGLHFKRLVNELV